jgi:hypothetical protein
VLLTTFYLTHGTSRSKEGLQRLREQPIRGHEIVVVPINGNVREAARRCVGALSPWTLVLTDEVQLYPGSLGLLLRTARWWRRLGKRLYQCDCFVDDPLTCHAYRGYVALYDSEALSLVGSADTPSPSMPPAYRARIFGFCRQSYRRPIGGLQDGTPQELYRRWFWLRLRHRLGLGGGPEPTVTEQLFLYRRTGVMAHLYAAAGMRTASGLGLTFS